MSGNRRIRVIGPTACAAVVAVSILSGCGRGQGTETLEESGSAGTSQAPAPGKNPSDEPALPTLPAAREPVLHVDETSTYTVQILDAKTMTDVPGKPPSAGTMALALLLRVEAEPRDRSIHAPTAHLGIDYPSRTGDLNAHIGNVLDAGTPYLTEDQMLFEGKDAKGIDPVFGKLQANTVYYHWVWQIVSEQAELTGASLCQTYPNDKNCIPIGEITAAS